MVKQPKAKEADDSDSETELSEMSDSGKRFKTTLPPGLETPIQAGSKYPLYPQRYGDSMFSLGTEGVIPIVIVVESSKYQFGVYTTNRPAKDHPNELIKAHITFAHLTKSSTDEIGIKVYQQKILVRLTSCTVAHLLVRWRLVYRSRHIWNRSRRCSILGVCNLHHRSARHSCTSMQALMPLSWVC